MIPIGLHKLETKADVLKYALEFTAEDGQPNYVKAQEMFFFFTRLVELPDTKPDSMDLLADSLAKIAEEKLSRKDGGVEQ